MSNITTALNQMFTNADKIIQSLGDEFTSQQFLRRVIHDHQHAYIDLLVACQHLRLPFDQAHQKIGKRLESVMTAKGYTKERYRNQDTNIFLKPTMLTIYRRSK
jgi:hypothetical protein